MNIEREQVQNFVQAVSNLDRLYPQLHRDQLCLAAFLSVGSASLLVIGETFGWSRTETKIALEELEQAGLSIEQVPFLGSVLYTIA